MKRKIAKLVNDPGAWRRAVAVAGCVFVCATAQAVNLTFDENGNAVPISLGTDPTAITPTQGYDDHGASATYGTLATDSEPSGGNAITLDYLLQGKMDNGSSLGWLEYGWVVVYAPNTAGVLATGDNTGTAQGTIVDLIHFDNSYATGSPNTYTPPNSVPVGSLDQIFYYSNEGRGNVANDFSGNVYSGNTAITAATITLILQAKNTVSIVEPVNGQIAYNPANYFGNGESAPGFNMTGQSGGTAGTQFTYTFDSVVAAPVPEPATMLAGAMLLLPFGLSTLRLLRNRKA